MTQRDATVIIIEFVREQTPDDKNVLRALKVLEKRAEVLRLRYERRHIEIPADLFEEPITLPTSVIRESLKGTVCAGCNGKKRARESFCTRCYHLLDGGIRKALWDLSSYDPAFCRAVRVLKETTLPA
ncbi:MAG TPA: hypothetical protein VF551_07085 [Chthoniobacterales bacterium]|jgi:hypothetical protein